MKDKYKYHRYIYSVYSLLLIAFIMVGCEKEINVTDNLNPITLQVSVNKTNGRALHLEEFLPDGAQIGVRVVDMNAASYDASVYNNVLYTASGNDANQKWNSGTQIMLSTTPANVYAYYPYSESVDITHMPIETESQTDYMYATSVHGIDYKNNTVNLEMNHVLTAIKLTLVYKGNLDSPKLSSVSFNSESCAKSAYMYGKDGSLSEFTGSNESFTLNVNDTPITADENNSANVQYMVVPTGVVGDIHFTCIINGNTYNMTASPQTALQAGRIHHFVAYVDDSSCTINNVSIENWTTQSFTATANTYSVTDVVKAVTADGRLIDVASADNTCIAVALTYGGQRFWIEKKEASNTTWKTAFTNSGATNTGYVAFYWGPYNSDIADIPSYTQVAPWSTSYSTYIVNWNMLNWGTDTAISDMDGQSNTLHLKNTTATDSYSAYPDAAFLVKEFNKTDNPENFNYTDWYIPACGELALIYRFRTAINEALTKIGGTAISLSSNYWSSSEYNRYYGYYIYFYNSYIYINRAYKYNYYRVRLIRKF